MQFMPMERGVPGPGEGAVMHAAAIVRRAQRSRSPARSSVVVRAPKAEMLRTYGDELSSRMALLS